MQEHEAYITITRRNDETKVKVIMKNDDFASFEQLARDRGVALAEVFAEALRLERLFADSRFPEKKSTLYVQQPNGDLRELVAI